ncbi:hypothetical protein CBR_g30515 [Chara braunii]|uniref:ABC transporter domain-containing protein n=2 Tax=Chara braunii TaxID=69332 RepID=A0A388LCV5_CHABU|nr:hypothetical protein CBR_g30515 [Chara braunii]|eukprot:GBG80147.1 hypothetical protein CBR_g30515 [Chara braunii]
MAVPSTSERNDGRGDTAAIAVNSLEFSYPSEPPLLSDFTLRLEPGSRCLLIGANGAGKTTILRILAGKHMVGGTDVVQILSRPAFHDTSLVCDGTLSYLGGSWSKTIGGAGDIPLQGDFSAEHMIFGVNGIDPERRDRLIDLLDIDLEWRMHKVSDGQRRRVQICMGLLRPYKVLLLDEITVDLDVVARMDLLQFFVEECEQRGCAILYATHIFDGLDTWATHVAYVAFGRLEKGLKVTELEGLHQPGGADNLLEMVEPWLRKERELRPKKAEEYKKKQEEKKRLEKSSPSKAAQDRFPSTPASRQGESLWGAGRHMAFYR